MERKWRKQTSEGRFPLFQQLQVTALAFRRPRSLLDIFEKLAEILFFGGIHSGETKTHARSRCAARDHSAQCKAFYPNFAACHPKPDLDFGAATDQACRLDLTSTQAGIGKVPPDRSIRVVDTQLHCHKTLDSGMPPSILPPVGTEDIRLKRRNGRSRRGQGLRGRFRRWFG